MVFIWIVLFLFTSNSYAGSEAYNNNLYCSEIKGIQEYRLKNKVRVDCLTEEYAIEMDWCSKWYEGITQALYYAMETNKRAKLVLIKKNSFDQKYINRANKLILFYKLPIDLEVIDSK
jgi:hypothetical protein